MPVIAAVMFGVITATSSSWAQGGPPAGAVGPRGPWSLFVRGGASHQLEADLDAGGDFSVTRLFVQPGVRYTASPKLRLSFTLGYGYDDYDFSHVGRFGGQSPWDTVNSLRVSAPISYYANDRWSVFAVPTVRMFYESGADVSESVTGGALAALSYRFSDRLSLGPGIGIFSQIEDGVRVLPILSIEWKITQQLSVTTGRGPAATGGPGITLAWKQNERLQLGLTGRIDKTRFRLDEVGFVPNGVGEDRSIGVLGSVSYRFNRHFSISAFGGASFDGELRVENSNGNGLIKESYDAAPLAGFTFRLRQ